MSASNVIYISTNVGTWIERMRHYDPVNGSTLTIYVNDKTNEVDVVQTNDDGESITTHVDPTKAKAFFTL